MQKKINAIAQMAEKVILYEIGDKRLLNLEECPNLATLLRMAQELNADAPAPTAPAPAAPAPSPVIVAPADLPKVEDEDKLVDEFAAMIGAIPEGK
jgi:hypothetical protein